MVVALVALVAAVSGSAIALPGKNKVTRNDIKRNAVNSPRIKNNSVKGADVDESSLGTVPNANNATNAINATNSTNATNATNAASAANAATVGGQIIRRFQHQIADDGVQQTVLDLGGFIITGTCPGGAVNLDGNNNSGQAAQLRFHGAAQAGGPFTNGFSPFEANTNADLNNSENLGSGQAEYVRADGGVVSVMYAWRNDGPDCRIWGHALAG